MTIARPHLVFVVAAADARDAREGAGGAAFIGPPG